MTYINPQKKLPIYYKSWMMIVTYPTSILLLVIIVVVLSFCVSSSSFIERKCQQGINHHAVHQNIDESFRRMVTITTSNNTTNQSSTSSNTTLDNTISKFCTLPNYTISDTNNTNTLYPTCKAQSETWKILISSNDEETDAVVVDSEEVNNINNNNNTDANTKNGTKVRELLYPNKDRSYRKTQEIPNDYLSGECGPQCRPSCITLLLDLDQIQYHPMICPDIMKQQQQSNDDCIQPINNPCTHVPSESSSSSWCNSTISSTLYNTYPECFLEDAKCFGPTIYDDIVAVYESRLLSHENHTNSSSNTSFHTSPLLPKLDHCTSIMYDTPFYQRFHGWKVITPMTVHDDCLHNDLNNTTNSTTTNGTTSSSSSNSSTCFGSTSNKLYFEYCHVVEEDYENCNTCSMNEQGNKECMNNCTKTTKPFPPGWTTFVVSASIPYNFSSTNNNNMANGDTTCTETHVPYANETNTVCFLQRIELFYPEQCPYCHQCPNVQLGDMFGPLQVVGFGHDIHQSCVPCNKPSPMKLHNSSTLSCSDIAQCHKNIVDCTSGESLGIPSFIDNQCSFQQDNEGVQEDSTNDDINPEDDDEDDDDRSIVDDDAFTSPGKPKSTKYPTVSPTIKIVSTSPTVNNDTSPTVMNDTTIQGDNNTTILIDTNQPTNMNDSQDTYSKNLQLSPTIISLIIIGLLIVVSIQLVLYKQRRRYNATMKKRSNEPRPNTEEIVYIEPLEFDGIDKILSNNDNASQKTDDDDDDEDSCVNDNTTNDAENPKNRIRDVWRNTKSTSFRLNAIMNSEHSNNSTMKQEIRHFQAASILERSDQNEIEALYMTGQHHIQLPS